MKSFYLTLLAVAALCLPLCVKGETAVPGQWRLHNTFDYYFQETVDTPERVYLLALGQKKESEGVWAKPSGQLFVLDKASGELTGYNANNYLTNNVVLDIAYNAAKGYLLVVYDDYTIDILTDDDKVYNIPGLASASLSTAKTINSITFDPAHDSAYLATDFGYIVIDDKRNVISESRVYNEKLNGMARVGDRLVAGRDSGLYIARAADRNSAWSDFSPVVIPGAEDETAVKVKFVLSFDDEHFGVVTGNAVFRGTVSDDGSVDLEKVDGASTDYFSENRDGYYMRRWGCTYSFDRTGKIVKIYNDKTDFKALASGSWDMTDFYYPEPRAGLMRMRYNKGWNTPGELFRPNAPQPFGVFGFDWSEQTGMLASNSTFNRFYSSQTAKYPNLVSGYERGEWSHYGSSASSSPLVSDLIESYPGVIDPLDNNYMWVGSRQNGLVRFDLRDNSAQMYSQPNSSHKGEKGFHSVFPYSEGWSILCNVSSPSFDDKGNLWCVFNPSHAEASGAQPIYCWKASDRKADNVSGFKQVPVKGYDKHYENLICTATKSETSRNFLVFAPSYVYQPPLYLFYHGGTPDDTSDDRLFSYKTFIDQDGGSVSYIYFNALYEDPGTGYIWVCTDTGVFYFNPNEALRSGDTGGTLHVRRVKVARNDGTNLADYLLDGYDVTCMATDGASRKWFGTMGGGVLVSSPEGSKVLERFTSSNSPLPSDNIYGIGFDPTGNAVWIGSDKQTATYFCDATPAASDYSSIVAYPNPVRPEHGGPVTIQGLMDNSLVKIADASGAVVKELGLSNGGMAQWDLTDISGREVGAGVYYILTSTTSESVDPAGATAKILVIR